MKKILCLIRFQIPRNNQPPTMKLGRRVTKQTPTTIGGGKKRIHKLDLIYKARKMGGQRNVDLKEFCS